MKIEENDKKKDDDKFEGHLGTSQFIMLLLAAGVAAGVSGYNGYFYLSAFERSQVHINRELGHMMTMIEHQDELRRVNLDKQEQEIVRLGQRIAKLEEKVQP